MRIILGSASPRRKELLEQIGCEFTCMVSREEEKVSSEIPCQVVEELSNIKAWDVYRQWLMNSEEDNHVLVIGADTIVAHGDKIMGKPQSKEDAKKMIQMLSGSVHQVYTGVTLIYKTEEAKEIEVTFHVCTNVYMHDISDAQIEAYLSTNESMGKAGAYAIQGCFAIYIDKIEGDYNNVVGLPVAAIYQMAKEKFGIDITDGFRNYNKK